MLPLTMRSITKVIQKLLTCKEWQDYSPAEINEGGCMMFAADILERYPRAVIYEGPYHLFVQDLATNLWHDSQAPEGVLTPLDLPIYTDEHLQVDFYDWLDYDWDFVNGELVTTNKTTRYYTADEVLGVYVCFIT